MNPPIIQWAQRHNISLQALHELHAIFGLHGGDPLPPEVKGVSEAAVQNAVRLEASRAGVRLWRNNVGSLIDARGVPVRYGLANDSKQLNEVVKSADLVGIRPVLITQAHVGSVIGQFVSRECKRVGWQYRGDARELAQLQWAQLIISAGGDAAFCTGVGTL